MMIPALRTLVVAAVAALPLLAAAATPDFVPLTSIPGVSETTGSPDLPSLLNNLYKISIGVAAVIAIIQIIRSGIMFMTNKGSISENEQAKQLLQYSIIGLILILSPAIVFGIVNPRILNLELDFKGLQSTGPASSGIGTAPDPGTVTETEGTEQTGGETTFHAGYFALKQTYPTESEADTMFARYCNTVPETHQDVIHHHNPSSSNSQCVSNGNNDGTCSGGYRISCESVSHWWKQYRVRGQDGWLYFTADGQKYNEFKSGCDRDAGSTSMNANGADLLSHTCSDEEREGFAAREGYIYECRSVRFECKK